MRRTASAPFRSRVAVARSDIARGDVIAEEDLEYKAISGLRANGSIVRAITDIAGKEARRALKAGELIRAGDLKRPTMVAKGSTVTMCSTRPACGCPRSVARSPKARKATRSQSSIRHRSGKWKPWWSKPARSDVGAHDAAAAASSNPKNCAAERR